MKPFAKLLLFLLLAYSGISQDRVINVTPAMSASFYIPLGNINGWLFKEGSDTTWAKRDLDISNWRRLKPSQLSEKFADKNGKVEGWFRTRIKLDTGFKDTLLELFMNAWAASDLYVDGKLVYTFGNTGLNGKPFKEYDPTYKPPRPLNLGKGIEYLIAVHIVDFVSSFPPYHLKSEGRIQDFICITTPEFKTAYLSTRLKTNFFRGIWISVNSILCLLFWLLTFQNRSEKNLLLIAFMSTIVTLAAICDQSIKTPGISYNSTALLNLLWTVLVAAGGVFSLIVMLRVFKRKITFLTKILMGFLFVVGIAQIFTTSNILLIVQSCLVIGTYTYYIITSWKNLTGAQWSVLVGVILVFVFGLTISIVSMAMPYNYIFILLLTSGVYLAFPVCLLIYVATRFKEIMIETQRRAKQVVQLSEQKKEQALQQQKILEEEVARQTVELRTSLENLKSTQTQLIQSEKMASLGELTAGIAHEIQNPLNFVNNFSEVSSELLDEIKSELDKGDIKEAKAITDDVKQNLEKITHHGKRADAIVKSMLQHSRKSSGQKDPVDINALVDEYLRLSYHGFRAKDKSFNAIIETHFDPNIDHASVVGQEIGRVLLNLFNNAFYAISEKKKIQQNDFEPAIQVTTHKMKDGIEIKVRDNGMGIPQKVLDKIFQPFFTTKPTGEGTGLGLSLSYDIITKGHGGELKVETKEGKGSEFIIQLPLN